MIREKFQIYRGEDHAGEEYRRVASIWEAIGTVPQVLGMPPGC